MTDSIITYANEALTILDKDSGRMDKIQRYFDGEHDLPYMPDAAEEEYKLLARRAITNWIPLLVNTPAQGLYVDNYRKNGEDPFSQLEDSPEWEAWQRSQMAAWQKPIYVDAFKFGHTFVLTCLNKKGDLIYRGLSARRTVALYEDPVGDEAPAVVVYVKKWPGKGRDGLLRVWDDTTEYEVAYPVSGPPDVT